MAALTLAEIRDQIRFRGDYQNVRKFPEKNLNIEIQKAFGKFWQIVADVHEGWWDTEDTVTTAANVQYVAPPKAAWRILAVDRLDGGEYEEMAQIPINQRNRFGNGTGKPLAYRITSRGLELYLTPDMAYTLRVMFTPKAPTLAESQPREYYNGWEEYVIEAVLLVLDAREKLPLTEREARVAAAEKVLTSGATEHRSQEPEYLRLREFDDFDPYKDGLF